MLFEISAWARNGKKTLILDESLFILGFSCLKFFPARNRAEFGHKMGAPEGTAWCSCGCHCASISVSPRRNPHVVWAHGDARMHDLQIFSNLSVSSTLERELQWERSGWVPICARCVTGTGPCRCLVARFAHRIVSSPSLLGEEEVTG